MTSIADAYVDLHVNGDALDGEVRRSVKDAGRGADKESDKTGKALGAVFAAGFVKNFAKIPGKIGGVMKDVQSQVAKGLDFGKMGGGGGRKGMFMALAAGLPLLTSGISALSGGLVALTGAIAQASTASLALAGVFGSLIQGVVVAKIAFKDFGKAVGGDAEALAALSPAARSAALAATGLGDAWGGVRRAIQQNTFKGLDGIITRIGKTTIPGLRQGLAGTGTVLNGLFKNLGRFVTSEGFVRRFGNALKANNGIFATLSTAAVPVLDGILRLFRALQPSGARLAETIARAGFSFQAWASAPGFAARIDAFVRKGVASMTNLWAITKNLGGVLRNVFGAATGAGDGLLVTLRGLTDRLLAFTELGSTKSAIAEWAQQGIDVSGQLFSALGKGFQMIAPLFNPAILGGFMDMFGKMMPTIQAVVGVLQGALAPVLSGIGDAFAENGPKFAALFSALGPLLGGIGAVIGQVISQALGLLGTIAAVITPVVRVISGVLGPVLTRFAPIIAFLILSFTTFGASLVRLVPVVGRFIAPLVALASTIARAVVPVVKVLGRIVGSVFKGIGTVVGFTMRAIGMWVKIHFTIIRVVVTTVMRAVFAVVRFVWRGISAVISGVVRVVSAVVRTGFNVIRTVIGTVLRVAWNIVRTVFNGIRSVISSVMGVIRGIISKGWNFVKSATSTAWNAIKSVASRAMNGLKDVIARGIAGVISFVRDVPGKIRALVGSFLSAGRNLGSSVISGIMGGLRAAGGFVSDLGSSIKGAINSALRLPFTIRGPGPLPDFTIPAFARGTIAAPGGLSLVGERGPEIVDLPRGSKVRTAAATRGLGRDARGGVRKVVLRIGSRDFEAYVTELADGRIEAADSLAYQGA